MRRVTPSRRITAAAAAAVVGCTLLAASPSAQAAPSRVPPWPSLGTAVPAGLQRAATLSTTSYLEQLDQRVDRRLRAAALGSDVSVRVEDLASGSVAYSHRARRNMIPASTQKTATALAVLSQLGAETVLPTRVLLDGSGTGIILKGGGDPTLNTNDLSDLARWTADALAEEGEPGTRYRVSFDDSVFAAPSLPNGWPSSYVGDYSANPTALTQYGSYSSDSATDTAKYFRKRLKANGLRPAPGVTRGVAPAGAREIAIFDQHTVADALWPMLHYSDNTIAEVMIRHVARARGTETTTTGSAAAVRSELAALGVPTGSMQTVDGSGLSRSNRVSTRTLVAITRAALNPDRPDLATGFRTAAFPLAGVNGTLETRFRARGAKCAVGRIMAKTGTLSNVVALSGIAGTADGRLRAFAIVVNNKPSWASLTSTRDSVDRIAAAIAGC